VYLRKVDHLRCFRYEGRLGSELKPIGEVGRGAVLDAFSVPAQVFEQRFREQSGSPGDGVTDKPLCQK
jgi:hypothetical protein